MAKVPLRTYWRIVEDNIKSGELDLAILHSKHILEVFPKSIRTYQLLAKAFLEKKCFQDAENIFERILPVLPDDIDALLGLSQSLEDKGDFDGALQSGLLAFDIDPSNQQIQSQIKHLYKIKSGQEPAKIPLTKAGMVRLYIRGEMFTQAINEIRSLLVTNPQRCDLMVCLAQILLDANKRVDATDTCTKIIRKLPYCFEANRILYAIFIQINRIEDSRIYLQRLTELDPYCAFITPAAMDPELLADDLVLIDLYLTDIQEGGIKGSTPSDAETPQPQTDSIQELVIEEPIDRILATDEQEEHPQCIETEIQEGMILGDQINDSQLGVGRTPVDESVVDPGSTTLEEKEARATQISEDIDAALTETQFQDGVAVGNDITTLFSELDKVPVEIIPDDGNVGVSSSDKTDAVLPDYLRQITVQGDEYVEAQPSEEAAEQILEPVSLEAIQIVAEAPESTVEAPVSKADLQALEPIPQTVFLEPISVEEAPPAIIEAEAVAEEVSAVSEEDLQALEPILQPIILEPVALEEAPPAIIEAEAVAEEVSAVSEEDLQALEPILQPIILEPVALEGAPPAIIEAEAVAEEVSAISEEDLQALEPILQPIILEPVALEEAPPAIIEAEAVAEEVSAVSEEDLQALEPILQPIILEPVAREEAPSVVAEVETVTEETSPVTQGEEMQTTLQVETEGDESLPQYLQEIRYLEYMPQPEPPNIEEGIDEQPLDAQQVSTLLETPEGSLLVTDGIPGESTAATGEAMADEDQAQAVTSGEEIPPATLRGFDWIENALKGDDLDTDIEKGLQPSVLDEPKHEISLPTNLQEIHYVEYPVKTSILGSVVREEGLPEETRVAPLHEDHPLTTSDAESIDEELPTTSLQDIDLIGELPQTNGQFSDSKGALSQEVHQKALIDAGQPALGFTDDKPTLTILLDQWVSQEEIRDEIIDEAIEKPVVLESMSDSIEFALDEMAQEDVIDITLHQENSDGGDRDMIQSQRFPIDEINLLDAIDKTEQVKIAEEPIQPVQLDSEINAEAPESLPQWVLSILGTTQQTDKDEDIQSKLDKAFAWLEYLASQKGVDEKTLLLPQDKRISSPPSWLLIQSFIAQKQVDVDHIIIPPAAVNIDYDVMTPTEPIIDTEPSTISPQETTEDLIFDFDENFQFSPEASDVPIITVVPEDKADEEELEDDSEFDQIISQFQTEGDILTLVEEDSPNLDEEKPTIDQAIEPPTAENEWIYEYSEEHKLIFDAHLHQDDPNSLTLFVQGRDALLEGKISEGADFYSRLVTNGKGYDQVIGDLQVALRKYPEESQLWQVLGDAFLRINRMQSALDAYAHVKET